ncbi:hypothetical protein NX059_011378 [Plenodomus lindquistii]|nr:hypothetical protein NX059_011378 [Plenodomus lindquistii]
MTAPESDARALKEEGWRKMSDKEFLQHMLSTRGSLATGTVAETQAQGEEKDKEYYRQIGKGMCGTIYLLGSSGKEKGKEKAAEADVVLKLPNSPAKVDELWMDWKMHWRVIAASAIRQQLSQPTLWNQNTYRPSPYPFAQPSYEHYVTHHYPVIQAPYPVSSPALRIRMFWCAYILVDEAMYRRGETKTKRIPLCE